MKRAKRTDLEGMLTVAVHSAMNTGTDRYVYPTANGYTIEKNPPPFANDRYYRVTPEPSATYHEPGMPPYPLKRRA